VLPEADILAFWEDFAAFFSALDGADIVADLLFSFVCTEVLAFFFTG
jgi:hypothetical protein